MKEELDSKFILMNRYLFEGGIMRVILCLFLISISVNAEVYFTDTKEETTLRKTYSRSQMKNKKVAKVNAFANREYYVFLGRDVNTLINLPYALKEKIINPASTFLDIGDAVGETYFFIKPKNVNGILDLNQRFISSAKMDFGILVNVEIIEPDSANQSITFIDGLSKDAKAFEDPSPYYKKIFQV